MYDFQSPTNSIMSAIDFGYATRAGHAGPGLKGCADNPALGLNGLGCGSCNGGCDKQQSSVGMGLFSNGIGFTEVLLIGLAGLALVYFLSGRSSERRGALQELDSEYRQKRARIRKRYSRRRRAAKLISGGDGD